MPKASADSDKTPTDLPRYQPLVIVLVAVCVGIVVDRYWPISVFAWWAVAAAACLSWLLLWRRHREIAAAVALLIAVAATAASWHHLRWYLFADDDLGRYAQAEAQPVCVEAIALQSARTVPRPPFDPMRAIPASERSQLDLELTRLRNGTRWQPVSGRSRLSVYGPLPQVQAGDRLQIFGRLAAPREVRNPGEFDRAWYVRADRHLSRIQTSYPECVSVLAPGRGFSIGRLIERTRAHGNRLLEHYLDPRRSALAAAVLLGAREQLDPDQTQAFMETGSVHLLAISGLHVGILAGALMFVMLRAPIPRGWAMLGVAAFAVFYMLLTDARPPVIRATMLVLVMCCAVYLGRRPLAFNSLAAAALIVLTLNPAQLFHTGAQLSFLAVAGLMWCGPRWILPRHDPDPLDRLIAESRSWPSRMMWFVGRSVRHLTLVSATIWLLVLPLVMARFHLLTPIAVVLNTVLWLPMSAALLSGFGVLVFGSPVPPLGWLFGNFCDGNLAFIQSSVALAREVPGSHFWVPGPADWWLIGFYGGLAVLAAFPQIRPPRRWCLALLAVWSTAGFAAAELRHDPSRLDCTFLSMGHGCAVVLQSPGGQTILYDAGKLGSPGMATRSIAAFLWSQGITHLDAVVLSHGDVDHYDALPGLLERFSIEKIYVSPFMFDEPNAALAALEEAIQRSGVPMREIHAGSRLTEAEGCRIEVLHPPQQGGSGSDNANSIALEVSYLGRSILLLGDIDPLGLTSLLARRPVDCDVLLAPHHGSRASNPPGLSEWSTPEWVVISGSHRWDSRPIEAAYRAAGSRVIHAADTGAVHVTIDATGVRVDGFLSGREP